MMWLGSTPTVFSVVAVYAHNQQFKLMAKEVKNGLISARSYMLATTMLEVPYMVILALSAMIIPLYGIGAGNVSGLVGTIFIMSVTLWCFECVGQFLAAAFSHAPVGMLAMLFYWISAFLFSGGFLKPEFIIWPFNKVVDVTPLFYTMRSLQYLELHGTVWDGARLSNSPVGFTCDHPGFCYGHTGDQVLSSLLQLFSSAVGDRVASDTLTLLVMAFGFKVLCFTAIVVRTRTSSVAIAGERGCIPTTIMKSKSLHRKFAPSACEQKDEPSTPGDIQV
jgi:hypothetical protein